MLHFEDIIDDIAWREEQLLIAKTLPYSHNFSNSHKEFLIKHSIPTIYAIWEGFVQNAFQSYARELNKLNLSKNDLCINIITHSVDSSFPQFKEYPSEFNNRVKFISKLDNYFNNCFIISHKINTNSNVEIEIINNILCRFNLQLLPNYPYRQQLKDLLKSRNRIAHGDNSLAISSENIDDFKRQIDEHILLIKNLMNEIFKRISDGFNIDKNYLR